MKLSKDKKTKNLVSLREELMSNITKLYPRDAKSTHFKIQRQV